MKIKLEPAFLHAETLKKELAIAFMDKACKFYFVGGYYNEIEFKSGNWYAHEFAVLYGEHVIGLVAASVDRSSDSIHGLRIINFLTSRPVIFGIGIRLFMRFLMSLNIRKVRFSVVIGNPVEKAYDRIVKKLCGRIVGVFKQDERLADGEYYDVKHYEIFNPKRNHKQGDNN